MQVMSFDLDSTVWDTQHRIGLIKENRKDMTEQDWVNYSLACVDDTPGPAWDLLMAVQHIDVYSHMGTIFVTRRDNAAREATEKKFAEHEIFYDALLMLKDEFSNEERSQPAWKVRAILDYQERTGNEVCLHVDDNAAVVEACKAAGIPAMRVCPNYETEATKGL